MPYNEHPVFETPVGETKIWRFMDVCKYLAFIQSSSLYFSRADRLGDSFEGSYPEKNIIQRNRYLDQLDCGNQMLESVNVVRKNESRFMFINCWHMNEYESLAMWQLYANNGQGIAIQSTVDRLITSLSISEDPIQIGKVKYIDYRYDSINEWDTFSAFLAKRLAYIHEQEVRAIIWKPPISYSGGLNVLDYQVENTCEGIGILLDREKLVEKVFIAPKTPCWAIDTIIDVTARYSEKIEVCTSSLDAEPMF